MKNKKPESKIFITLPETEPMFFDGIMYAPGTTLVSVDGGKTYKEYEKN